MAQLGCLGARSDHQSMAQFVCRNGDVPKLSADDLVYLRNEWCDNEITEYIRYMTLVKSALCMDKSRSTKLAPSKAVDAVWRDHIDGGDLYSKFCVRTFEMPNVIIKRVEADITYDNYQTTLKKLESTFGEGTAVGKANYAYWPAYDYCGDRRRGSADEDAGAKKLTFTEADLDRLPQDVFAGKHPERLVDAFTFLRAYLADRMKWHTGVEALIAEGGGLLRASGLFPGGLSEFKAALVGCNAMHVACGLHEVPAPKGTLRNVLADYVTSAKKQNCKVCIPLVPVFPQDGGDLVEWLGRFNVEQLFAQDPFRVTSRDIAQLVSTFPVIKD